MAIDHHTTRAFIDRRGIQLVVIPNSTSMPVQSLLTPVAAHENDPV
jgi:hypothetical protein